MAPYTRVQQSAEVNRHYDEKTKQRLRRRNRRKNRKYLPGPLGYLEKKGILRVGMGIDLPFFLLIIILMVIGMIMMFSASYPKAYDMYNDSYYFLVRQIRFAVVGIIGMMAVSYINYNKLHKLAVIFLIISYIALVAVLFTPSQTGTHRWFEIGSLRFQASEITKFALILFFAHWGSKYYDKMHLAKYSVVPALLIFGTTAVLLYKEPHYSCIVIVAMLTAVMVFIYGIPKKYLFIAGGALVVLVLVLAGTGGLSYAMERMDGWGQALEYTTKEMWDLTWQTRNSLYAIGSGGLFGLGLGQSRQKYGLLPEPQNDFIFAIVCEELGLVGAIIILSIFALLVWRGITLSLRAKDKFGKLLGIGLTSQVAIQVILNILVITDWLPNTGISLPFFSYGGTSLIMLLLQMGIVLSISRTANIEKQ